MAVMKKEVELIEGDLRGMFDLDEGNLDRLWAEQPKLFFRYAEKLADARSHYEWCKARKDLASAEVDREVREDPAAFGLSRVTEGAVDKVVILQPSYQEAVKALIEAKHAMDVCQAVVDALEHRKKALENRVHLFAMNYFGTPREPRETVVRDQLNDRLKQEVRRKGRVTQEQK